MTWRRSDGDCHLQKGSTHTTASRQTIQSPAGAAERTRPRHGGMRPGLQFQNEPPVSCELRRLVLGSLLTMPGGLLLWTRMSLRGVATGKEKSKRAWSWAGTKTPSSGFVGSPPTFVLLAEALTTWASVTARTTARLLNQQRGWAGVAQPALRLRMSDI